MVGLRDPHQISPHILGVSADVAYLLQFFDGGHTLEEIRSEYFKIFRKELPETLLHQVVETLDQSYFLDNETFRGHFTTLRESFRRANTREAFHSGASYPSDSVALRQTLGELFSPPKGPGLPGDRTDRVLQGLIVPHIDLRIGGHAYARAYKELAEAQKPDLIIVFGTAHSGLKNHFSLTRKSFRTPLGELPVDTEFLDRLFSFFPSDLLTEEFAHRTEHTIEFQVLFLQLLFGAQVSFVPILCSFAHSMVRQGTSAEQIRSFLAALRNTIRTDGRRICLIASADLAHVGPRYGDSQRFSGESLANIKEADLEMLRHAQRIDAEGFLDYIAREEDRRRICGFSPVYALLNVLDAREGVLLAHDHGDMDTLGSVCSFASMVFD